MNKFEPVKIETNLMAKPLLILAIWLFLLIIPYISLLKLTDYLISDSETRMLSETKARLINEFYDFKAKLNSLSFINTKLSEASINTILKGKGNGNANQIRLSLEKELKSSIAAIFCYNSRIKKFDSYIHPELRNELGMFSKTMITNLMISYGLNTQDLNQQRRSISYLEQFLTASADLNLIPNQAIPVLSGKSKLLKLIAYLKTISSNDSNTAHNLMLILIRDQDIPIFEIMKTAAKSESANYKRHYSYLKNDAQIPHYFNAANFYKFIYNDKNELSIISPISQEIIVKACSRGTYYPFDTEKLQKEMYTISVTANHKELVHPLRDVIERFRFPAIIAILLISFSLVRILIFGYAGNIRILNKVIICMTCAVLLPSAFYAISAYYNQSFSDEYIKDELQQFTQIQAELINQAIDSSIVMQEQSISDLKDQLSNLNIKYYESYLDHWIRHNNASIISLSDFIKEQYIQIKIDPQENLNALEKDARMMSNVALKNSFKEQDLSDLYAPPQFKEKFSFDPEGMGLILTKIGKLYSSVPNQPNTLYSVFPVFANKKSNLPTGSLLIKFETNKLISNLINRNAELLKEKRIDNYVVRNAILPITADNTIPDNKHTIMTPGFNLDRVLPKAKQVLSDKSNTQWKTDNTVNSAIYMNLTNSIIISTATKIDKESNVKATDIKIVVPYVLLTVLALSMLLGGIIVSPVKLLKSAAKKVAAGDYTQKIDYISGDELEDLSDAFNDMTDGLLQKEKMTSYVSTSVIKEVSQSDEMQLQPGGERIPVSVLFCALKGPKNMNDYSPEEITKTIGVLVDSADEIATANNGQIDKLIEDTLMIVFRKTKENENIVKNACLTALGLYEKMGKELPEFRVKMGIASGDAVSGKIGSRNGKLDYTVIGNPVNLAARLKVQADKGKETGILICPNSIRLLNGLARVRFIERLSIKGRTNRTFPLYELLSLRK